MALVTKVFRMAQDGDSLTPEAWHAIQAELEAVIFVEGMEGCGFAWNAEPWSSQLGEPCTRIATDEAVMAVIEADPRSVKVADL